MLKWKLTTFAVAVLVLLSFALNPSASKTFANDSDEKSNGLSQELLDKNVDFREKFGLKADSDFVEKLASENHNKTEQEQPDKKLKGQIYLTSNEYEKIKERWSELDKAVDEIREFSDDNWQEKFAGLWVDQKDGGVIHVGVKSPKNKISSDIKNKVTNLYYKPKRVSFYQAEFSKDELHDMSDKIHEDHDMLENKYDIDIVSIQTDIKNQNLVVGMEEPTADKKDIIRNLYEENMIISAQLKKLKVINQDMISNDHYGGGLALSPECTLGFTAEDRGSNKTYALTAGHCKNATYYQGGGKIGSTVRRKNSGSVDAQTISIASSNTSPWVFDGYSPHQLKNWEKAGQGYVGQHVIMSGKMKGNRHGQVTDTYVSTGSYNGLTSADYNRTGGDSGATVYDGSTLTGLHHGYLIGSGDALYTKVSNIVAEFQIDPVTN